MEYIKLQLGCLVILSYIAVIYFRECKVYNQDLKKSSFDEMLILAIFSVVFDGLTAYSVNNISVIGANLNTIFHALFLVGVDSVIFALCVYILVATGTYPKTIIKKMILYFPFIINITIVLFNINSLEYYQGKYTRYSMGTSAYTCFIMAAVYVAISLIAFISKRHYIESHKRIIALTYLMATVIITTIQMVFPEVLLTSLAVTIFVIGVYLNLEDPAFRQLSDYHGETVMAFANLIENRDNNTGGHIKRTSRYVEMIANKLRDSGYYTNILTKDYISNLKKAAPMHDIGKIAVPDAVLQKPGKFTDEEFEIMKQHSAKGASIIEETFVKVGNEEFRMMAYEVAKYHHEKWNGKGYPEGLAEEEIPLCARIMSVADVFDAVSEKRCYRDAMPIEKCFDIIKQGSGRDFDPIIAQAFLDIRHDIEQVHGEFAESLQ